MLITALAMFLMSRLSIEAAFLDSAIPFVLLAFGLSPVFVGATEIIVGNAPEELSGVAGGLQQSAMQVGGALGTAILGAIVAAKVAECTEGYLGPVAQGFTPEQLDGPQGRRLLRGVAPTGLPEQIAGAVTNAVQPLRSWTASTSASRSAPACRGLRRGHRPAGAGGPQDRGRPRSTSADIIERLPSPMGGAALVGRGPLVFARRLAWVSSTKILPDQQDRGRPAHVSRRRRRP